MGPRKFRETFGQTGNQVYTMSHTSEETEQELVEAEEFVASSAQLLRIALGAVNANHTAYHHMHHHDVEFGITKNRETFSVLSLTRGHYHPIGNAGNYAIVIYKEAKHIGFGLFDEDQTTCLPIDIDEVIMELMEAHSDPIMQRMQMEMLLLNLDHLTTPES